MDSSIQMPQRTLQLQALFPVRSTGSINPWAPRTCGTLARPQRWSRAADHYPRADL